MSCPDQEPRSRPRALLCWFWRSCYALWLEEKCGANFVTDLPPCFFPRLEPASHLKRFENDSDWLILLPVFSSCNWSESSQRVLITVKPRYNEVPGITIDMFRENSASACGCVLRHYSYSKLYGKERGYKETSFIYWIYCACPLALRYIEVALYAVFGCTTLK